MLAWCSWGLCCEIGTEDARSSTVDYQAAIATPNRPAMNAAWPRMSFFDNHRICPLRIMLTVSIPWIVRHAE